MNLQSRLTIFIIVIASSFAINFPSRFPGADLNHILHWGTYKSHCYHAITEQTSNGSPMTLAVQIASNLTAKSINNLYYYFRDLQSPDDDKTQLYYVYHNGFYFAEQALQFNEHLSITNAFLKTNVTQIHQSWFSLTEFHQTQGEDFITLFYSIGLESYWNNDTRYIQYDPSTNQVKVFTPGNPLPQRFAFTIYQNGQVNSSGVQVFYQTFADMNRTNLWQIPNITYSALDFNFYKDYLTLSNKTASNVQNTSLLLVQFKIPLNNKPAILVQYDSNLPITIPTYQSLRSQIQARETEFLNDFNQVFPNIKNPEEYEMALYALSNLIGGIIYYYGPILIKEDPTPQPPLPFFTATPTRNSFERGFLWDEGFHNLLICRWSPDLCTATMNLWFNSQYKTGWIAREQARGDEIQSMIPGDFLVQSNLEGNPPTLMMAIDYLLSDSQNQKLMTQFLQTNYNKIYKWWYWFYTSQQVYDSQGRGLNLFLWSSKNFSGSIQYFGSGLDDYPRGDPGLISKYHLDLHVWEIVFAQVMYKIASFMNDKGNMTYFSQLNQTLIKNLNVFLDPADNLYKDVFQPVNDSSKSVPSSHVGYVTLMPLLFGLVAENSPSFNATLNLVDSTINGVMWSPSGILSLARNDSAFEKNSNYWTGPIWVNFNYLLLRSFTKYFPTNKRAQTCFTSIKNAIVGTMIQNFENTGYIWEHYNHTTAKGEGNHPFTGWSTLIVLPLAQDYN